MDKKISKNVLRIIAGLTVYVVSIFLIFYGLILTAYFNDFIGIEVIAGSPLFVFEVIIICLLAITLSIVIARFFIKLLSNKKKYVGIIALVVLILIALAVSPVPFIFVLF
jgi:hypothetical protein